MNDSKQQK